MISVKYLEIGDSNNVGNALVNYLLVSGCHADRCSSPSNIKVRLFHHLIRHGGAFPLT